MSGGVLQIPAAPGGFGLATSELHLPRMYDYPCHNRLLMRDFFRFLQHSLDRIRCFCRALEKATARAGLTPPFQRACLQDDHPVLSDGSHILCST